MRLHLIAATALALTLAACGGGKDYDQLVSFGDSLSDVGSYRTPGMAAVGGGKYTVNGPGGSVWVERVAEALNLPAPCAAQTGLNAVGAFAAFAGAITNHPGCTAYGQGGARVTNPIGPWNAALKASSDPTTAFQAQLGQLTVPLATQVANHLKAGGGRFDKHSLVLALAGGNDLFMNSGAIAAGQLTPEGAVQAMGQAGAELAQLVKKQMLTKGAKRVVVVNLPNVALTPSSVAQGPAVQALVTAMSQAYNAQLAAGLDKTPGVLLVDAFALSNDQAANPARYGLSNLATPACSSTSPLNPIPGYSLTCTTASTLAGVDVSRYAYADSVHPTPYAHSLLAKAVLEALARRGWL
jgi:outer membrane lipase/esterase